MATFNLLTEPWIPVMDMSGKVKEMGILDTLYEAHNLAEISDPSPLIQFGIYRLLIAFVMDAMELKNEPGLRRAIERKQFDMSVIDAYTERWKNRFDLFDKEHPFMQSPENNEYDKEKNIWRIQYLMHHTSPSLIDNFFSHGIEDAHAFSYEQCVKGLVAIPPFTFYTGRTFVKGINRGPPLYVLIKGENLFQTILYNSCVIDYIDKPKGNEPPAWRSDMIIKPELPVDVLSLLQGLTWRPRRIRLLPGEGGICTYTGKLKESLVRTMYFGGGLKATGKWADPQVAYEITEEEIKPIRPLESREPWRDMGPLMLLHRYDTTAKKENFEQPAVVSQYTNLVEMEAVSDKKPLILELYGLRKDGKEVRLHEWTIERLSLPWGVLLVKNAGKQVQDAMDCAEIVVRSVGWAIKKAYPRSGEGNKNALGHIIDNATYAYWSSVKPQFMEWFLKDLSSQQADHSSDPDAPQRLLNQWKEIIMKEGSRCLDNAIDPLDTNAKELERRVLARNSYWMNVKSQLYPETRKKKSRKGGNQSNDS